MARKADLQYVHHYYTAGTAAKKVAVKAEHKQKKPLPLFEPLRMAEPDQKIVAMSFSLNYSNFSMLLEFPLFMYNVLEYYIPSTLTETVYEVNETVSLNSRSEFLLLTDPNNTETELRTFPDSILLKTPGLYKVSQTPISGEEVSEYFFVKLPAAESNINTSEDTLSNPFFVEREEIENQDLLLYFALALIALLFAEWWLQSKEQF